MRTKNNWTGERKTILTKDDEENLSSKHLHGALKSQDKQSPRSLCVLYSGVCTLQSHVTKLMKVLNIGHLN